MKNLFFVIAIFGNSFIAQSEIENVNMTIENNNLEIKSKDNTVVIKKYKPLSIIDNFAINFFYLLLLTSSFYLTNISIDTFQCLKFLEYLKYAFFKYQPNPANEEEKKKISWVFLKFNLIFVPIITIYLYNLIRNYSLTFGNYAVIGFQFILFLMALGAVCYDQQLGGKVNDPTWTNKYFLFMLLISIIYLTIYYNFLRNEL
jgi:hypothetical protein